MKRTAIMAIVILALTMASCSSSQVGSAISGVSSTNGLTVETELMLGIIKLEDTEYAVTADQAKDFILLWQVYKQLDGSSTAAQEEIDGLVTQIQETMTSFKRSTI